MRADYKTDVARLAEENAKRNTRRILALIAIVGPAAVILQFGAAPRCIAALSTESTIFISRTFAALALAGSLLVPALGYSKIGQRPDTPNVVVTEIGTNWIRIQSIDSDFNTNTHMYEVQTLGDYTCAFWNRKAVIMPQSSSSPDLKLMRAGIPQVITFYFLIACAMP